MEQFYDLVIIGSGSAGMTAGLYAGRSKLKTLIIDQDKPGGQIKITAEVVNYPGILHTSGAELSETMRKQAENFGVTFLFAEVKRVDFRRDIKKIITSEGEISALAVIIATGAQPRKLGFLGEDTFRGRGIGYCATCDGEFFSGMDVFVIGAGFAAAEEAIFLTRYARKVIVIAREPEFTCSKTIGEKVLSHPKIEVRFHTELLEVGGENVLQYARFINNQTGETSRYDVKDGDTTFGVFVFVGYMPQSGPYREEITLDAGGYIPTDDNMMTNVPGVYAAGDVRPKILRQLVTAVSDGAIAATAAERYIEEKKAQLGLHEQDEPKTANVHEAFFDEALKEQLIPILGRFERRVNIRAILGQDDLSLEMESFLQEFAGMTDRVGIEILRQGEDPEAERAVNATLFPTFALLDEDGAYLGVQFHGVPGGHEINSFVLALYNAAGPGQDVGEETLQRIKAVKQPVNIKIGATLSCTLCPGVVTAAQLMALKNRNIEAEMIDVARYPDFKSRHSILSVPAIVINDQELVFGKKSIEELLEIISA